MAADFLRNLVDSVPYKINTIVTYVGTRFTDLAGGGWSVSDIKSMRPEGFLFHCHSSDTACADLDIEHLLTEQAQPWTNDQVERMNRTIKEATVKRYHYEDRAPLRQYLHYVIAAYNFGRRLKILKGLTPYAVICKQWARESEPFKYDPLRQMSGLKVQIDKSDGQIANRWVDNSASLSRKEISSVAAKSGRVRSSSLTFIGVTLLLE